MTRIMCRSLPIAGSKHHRMRFKSHLILDNDGEMQCFSSFMTRETSEHIAPPKLAFAVDKSFHFVGIFFPVQRRWTNTVAVKSTAYVKIIGVSPRCSGRSTVSRYEITFELCFPRLHLAPCKAHFRLNDQRMAQSHNELGKSIFTAARAAAVFEQTEWKYVI